MDFDFVVIMLHVLLLSEVLSRNHVFYQLIDQFLRLELHLTSHQEGGSPCEWPALSSFLQTTMFQFGQSCINLLTGLGYTDCGRHKAVAKGPILRPWPDQFGAKKKRNCFKTKIIQLQSRHFPG